MRNLFVFVFSFILIFSSSCAMKKLAVRQLGAEGNIPTKTSPFVQGTILSPASETCTFGKQKRIFTKGSPFANTVKKHITLKPFSIAEHYYRLGINLSPPPIFSTSKKYIFAAGDTPLYLKLGRIIYYA